MEVCTENTARVDASNLTGNVFPGASLPYGMLSHYMNLLQIIEGSQVWQKPLPMSMRKATKGDLLPKMRM